MKNIFLCSIVLLLLFSCSENKNTSKVSFYHWKSKAVLNSSIQEALQVGQTDKIYLHYFDVKTVRDNQWGYDEVFPTYVIKEVADGYRDYEIVPVIYITNEVFKSKNLLIADLVDKITKLTHQISKKHFGKEIRNIQIDCDWTGTTKNSYFDLLNKLNSHFEINATIRLHQITYQKETGVPPVKSGTLMLYNVGDLKNKEQNSILESGIVSSYVNSSTQYPIPLHVGLPLFSQSVVFNKNNKLKLINHTNRKMLENDKHFEKIDNQNFAIKLDTLYKGFYLNKGCSIKLEELNENEVIKSYQIIKKSQLHTNEIIFYHLDEKTLNTFDLKAVIKQL